MISVIMPLSRTNEMVGKCFRSIANQSYENYEVIVQRNKNPQISRNAGAKKAIGDYLFFCDDDIILRQDCFQKMLDASEANPRASIIYCDYARVGILDDKPHIARPWDRDQLLRDNYISTMSLVKKNAFDGVGGFDEAVGRLQDWDLWVSMALAGETGVYVPGQLFTAHYDNRSITSGDNWQYWKNYIVAKHSL